MSSNPQLPDQLRPEIIGYLKKCTKKSNSAVIWYALTRRDKAVNIKTLQAKVKEDLGKPFKDRIQMGYAERKTAFTPAELSYLVRLYRVQVDSIFKNILKPASIPTSFSFKRVDANGVAAEWQVPREVDGNRTILYIHGGGFFVGSVAVYRKCTAALANRLHARLLSVDYRLAPEHPFPAGLDDCVSAYKWLLSTDVSPAEMIIAGDSAGGALALSTLLKLKQDGLPLPRAAVCFSPVTDLTYSGQTWISNERTDPIIRFMPAACYIMPVLYAGEAGPKNPLVSPIFGDYHGMPPILIQVSRHEMLYSDATRFTERAIKDGVDVTLQEWDGMIHVFQCLGIGTSWPEVSDALTKVKEFIDKVFHGTSTRAR
nr:alpha/beta hydrolase [Candidatus Sigynarchaeum springense]